MVRIGVRPRFSPSGGTFPVPATGVARSIRAGGKYRCRVYPETIKRGPGAARSREMSAEITPQKRTSWKRREQPSQVVRTAESPMARRRQADSNRVSTHALMRSADSMAR